MSTRATISRFPHDIDALEAGGIPWGITVTPFSQTDELDAPPAYGPSGHLIPRCENCYAYFNTYCELEQWSWSCSLCGTLNGLTSESVARYSDQQCPEMISSFIDLELPTDGSDGEGTMQACPVYVAAVDLSSSEEFLELTKSALLAALEALAPGSLFGLATFSHKLGIYDVQGPIPVIKNIFIPQDVDGTLPIELEDVMPLLSFLAPVETCKERIAAALETLKPTTSWERTTAAGQGLDGLLMGGRGFGLAMGGLINYLASEYGNTFALVYKLVCAPSTEATLKLGIGIGCMWDYRSWDICISLTRIFAFLSGPPDFGAGQLDTRRYGEQYASKGEDADRALLPEQTPFYKDLATVAVEAGVCVDIFAVTNEYTDLASLKFLSIESGGSLFLYSSTDDSTLPQDMYRMLSRPYAFGCILRLRTSTEFKPGHSYGHFFPDPLYENVQHIICCDSYASYAYDFEFANSVGFSRHTDPPIIQIAFQYSVVVPPDESSDLRETPGSRPKHSVKRRLRIKTLQFGTAGNISELYDSVDPEVVLSILVHKVISASLEQGVREGRMLLQDWLVILTAQYIDACKFLLRENGTSSSHIDVDFSQCPQLQSLPRLVFALLRNPLLRFHEEGVHPDYRIYLQCLFSALDPSSLHRAVYPVLTSYATPDKQAFPRHSLSRAALITSESPIFFLDAFTTLIVYYSSTADSTLPFPPPQDCLLRTTINKLKQERSITPKLIFIHGGHEDATAFENYLIEEQDVDGSGLTSIMGYVSFLEEIKQNVLEYIK